MDLWELFADRDDALVLEVRPCRGDLGLRDFELLLLEVSPSVCTGRFFLDPIDETLSFELPIRRPGGRGLRDRVDRVDRDLPEDAL